MCTFVPIICATIKFGLVVVFYSPEGLRQNFAFFFFKLDIPIFGRRENNFNFLSGTGPPEKIVFFKNFISLTPHHFKRFSISEPVGFSSPGKQCQF